DNDVHTDFGPPLSHALPQWTQKLRTEELVDLLQDAMKRKQLREEVRADRTPGAGYVGLLVHGRFDRIWLLRCPHDRTKEGLTIAELAARRGVDPWTAYFDVIVEEQDRAVGLFDYMDTEEIKSTLRHPLVMICSDGWVAPKEERTSATAPHQPCSFGEFPGVLQRFVVEEPVLTLPNAIYKMTGMPAKRLGLKDRGLIREGCAADLVVFDLPRTLLPFRSGLSALPKLVGPFLDGGDDLRFPAELGRSGPGNPTLRDRPQDPGRPGGARRANVRCAVPLIRPMASGTE